MAECPSAGGDVGQLEVPRCLEEHELVQHSAKMLADLLWPSTVHAVRQQFHAYVSALCRALAPPTQARPQQHCGRSPNVLHSRVEEHLGTLPSHRQTGTLSTRGRPQTHALLNEGREGRTGLPLRETLGQAALTYADGKCVPESPMGS